MSDKLPQPTGVLVQRLRRVTTACDHEAESARVLGDERLATVWLARANTCLQAAARLEELEGVIANALV